ncbi:alanine/glycine:cation symporter family protein [Corynebacterium stationis]|uniref:alanine/glycine:cation symporter family protein n=2 Tax=Corynebacterium stationis TaxID=1705 RepID=UPI0024329064|nr:alanine/glycine:cation symporter family protein [Corynebacterium stationis]
MSSTLTTHILAQEDPGGIDGAIQSVFGPFVDFLETAVFFSVPVLGADLPLVVVWLVAGGVFCNVYLRVRPIKDAKQAIRAVRGMLAKKSDPGQVTSFQAFATELAGTIGLGNIAGVAVAITMGGPGASFWIAAAGVLGMAVKLAEATLGQMFRRVNDDGTVAAGPMYFLEYGLKSIGKPKLGRSLGFFYAIGMALAVMGAGNIFQANQVAMHLTDITGGEDSFLFGNGWIVGLAIAIPAAVVLIGGINSIANATSRLVPVMSVLYAVAVIVVLGFNFSEIPNAFVQIFQGAFTPEGISGGILGVAIIGIQRALFSNVAGVGTAALAHGVTKNRRPAEEGLVAAWEPFLDSVIVCTLTAIAIIVTGEHLNAGADGITLATNAFATVSYGFTFVLTACIVLFAFSTVLSYCYYGQINFGYIFNDNKRAKQIYSVIYIIMIVVGASVSLDTVVRFSDATFFLVAIPNLLGIYLLAKPLRKEISSYREAAAAGEIEPVPEKDRVNLLDNGFPTKQTSKKD